MPRGAQQSRALLRGDAGCSATEGRRRPPPHFDEHHGGAVARDDVDFTEAALVVLLDDAHAAAREKLGGQRFELDAAPVHNALLMKRTGGNAEVKASTLYVVATPIGHLQDVTLRALDVLAKVDVVAAEDTRVTARLLDQHGINAKKLIAVHEHNEAGAAERVVEMLGRGQSIALVSDAGTPAFSDPGARIVSAVRRAGYAVVPIPGANAAAAALSASGLAGPRFLFHGFLPPKAGERRKSLEALKALPYTLVFYEAPHRVLETMRDLADVLGGARRIVIARELTKLFETIHECAVGEAHAWLADDPDRLKGEFVLIVEGAQADADAKGADAERVLNVLLAELPVKQAAALAAKISGARKNDLYALALTRKARED